MCKIHLFRTLTIQFYGGKRVVNFLRGEANQGAGKHGSLPIDPQKWNLFVPANSTLSSKIPPWDPYEGISSVWDNVMILQGLTEETIDFLLKGMKRKEVPLIGGLVFDEIEIRSGLIYLKATGQLMGRFFEIFYCE